MEQWYSIKDAPVRFPVLDMQLLLKNEREREKLRNCISLSGIFYLTNFGLKKSLLDRFIKVTELFFKSEDELLKEQMICRTSPLRGYTPLKTENLSQLLGHGDSPDLCMKYSWASANNVSPSEEFNLIWQEVYSGMKKISQVLLKILSEIFIDLTHITLDDWDQIIDGDNMLRHLYYPELNDIQKLSMAQHSDLGSLSLLYQTPAKNKQISLQAKDQDRYVPVPAIKDTLVVNFGDILEHITKGRVRATQHRVLHHINSARTSTVFFCLPQRNFNLQKFKGSDFSGLLTEDIKTFADLIDKDADIYSNKLKPIK